MTASFDIFVEIPSLSLLIDHDAAQELTGDRVAVNIQRLAFQSDASDIWNLPVEGPAVAGALDMASATPRVRCALPLPEPGEVALYRVVILKTGAVIDSAGETRAEHLLPTEEELLFFVVGSANGQQGIPQESERLIPGVQYVVIPAPMQ